MCFFGVNFVRIEEELNENSRTCVDFFPIFLGFLCSQMTMSVVDNRLLLSLHELLVKQVGSQNPLVNSVILN